MPFVCVKWSDLLILLSSGGSLVRRYREKYRKMKDFRGIKRNLLRTLLFWAAIGLAPVAHAIPTTIDFEGLAGLFPNDTTIGDGIAVADGGVVDATFHTVNSTMSVVLDIDSNAQLVVLGVPGCPNSGDPACVGTGVLKVTFDELIASISLLVFDSTFPVVMEAYDASGAAVLDASGAPVTSAACTPGGCGVPGPDKLAIDLASAQISYVLIRDSGNDYFLDNFTFDTEPYAALSLVAPGTLGLLGFGLAAGVGLRRRKKQIT